MENQDYTLAAMHDYLYARLGQMQEEKAKSTHVPNMVTRHEFMTAINEDIRKVLNRMFVEREIKVHKTIHSKNEDFVELINR